VDKKLDGALVGDSFRVVPNNPADGPLIYAVLASSLARDFLSGSAYGSVVDHASLEQLRSFRMPQFTPIGRSKITETVTKAFVAREQAYELLDTAQQALLQTCGLPPLIVYEGAASRGDVTKVMVESTELTQATPGGCEFRLEAHFYNPIARSAVATIRKCQSKNSTVGELTHDVIMGGRFKRNYVEADFGTRFLSGKNIGQIRPTDLKYLSNTETEGLDDLLLKKGWTLLTCSGTIGRTAISVDFTSNRLLHRGQRASGDSHRRKPFRQAWAEWGRRTPPPRDREA